MEVVDGSDLHVVWILLSLFVCFYFFIMYVE